MCGIAGIVGFDGGPSRERDMRQMLAMIRHRGPDQFGIYADGHATLGSSRLSIIDLGGGQQPISGAEERFWIVFNGEIFNYVELRRDLESRGHRFLTNSDTEVLLHMYQEYSPGCLDRLNGQFAVAIWDSVRRELFLARDRLGIRPLFYTQAQENLVFASEVKALLACPGVRAQIDPVALDQIFVYWSTLPGRTAFAGIRELPPGHFLLARDGRISVKRYWQVQFPCEPDGPSAALTPGNVAAKREELRSLLLDATRIRLRADVPVGAYLSGGLDSSLVTAMAREYTGRLQTFSISFSDPAFDEAGFQRVAARFLGTDHHVVHATYADIGTVFPDVVWHTETPVLRTAPAPMFLLSGLVRDRGFKVVLTGEGADEFLGGYDIFKEAKIRRFCARMPASQRRPMLFRRLYADIPGLANGNLAYLAQFFGSGSMLTSSPDYSHALRWRNTGRGRRLFSAELREAVQRPAEGADAIPYPPEFSRWGSLQQSQYLESTIFLSQYLLSSQGDRVAMGHSVESRLPFLDYRVVEFCNGLHASLKLNVLRDKYLLREVAREVLPEEIRDRPKRPYRAPIHRSFFNPAPDYVRELLSPRQIAMTGLFLPAAVARLTGKIERGMPLSETDDMALAGIVSTQLADRLFVSGFRMPPPVGPTEDVKLCLRNTLAPA